jgi:hypothetical protein
MRGARIVFRAGIYIGWVGYLNLGDEAMFELCRNRFPSIRWSRLENIAYGPDVSHFAARGQKLRQLSEAVSSELLTQRRLRAIAVKAIHKVALLSGREVGLCGGGTYINRNAAAIENYISVRSRTRSLVPTFGTGVIQPEFWSNRENGWIDRRKDWVSVLAELPVVGVRGPISKSLLDDAGARNVVVCGDPAVAFHATYAGKPRSRSSRKPLRIGINAGDCSGQLWGQLEDVQDSFVALARWLRQAGHEVEIIPVWQKDVEACLDVARRAELDQSAVSPVCYTHDAFLSRIEKLDVLVALKLHAGILAAAANVPFVSLEYQPKCRDFASSIGWNDFSIRTDELMPGKLIDIVAALMTQLETRSAELCKALCNLMNIFKNYCDTIEPLLLRAR